MNKTTTGGGGVSFLGLLGILFIGLKLTGHITWPWWLVTLPLWGGAALLLAIAALIFVVAAFVELFHR